MDYSNLLNISVTVIRKEAVLDAYGDTTDSTTSTVIADAALWQASGNESYISEGLRALSTHVLVVEPGVYSWDMTFDKEVIYDGDTYRIIGRPDDVMNRGDIEVVPLELVQ